MKSINNGQFDSNKDFKARKQVFISTLHSEKGNYRISDTKSLNFFTSNIDVILSILSLNFQCVCDGKIFITDEKTANFEYENKNKYFKVESKKIECRDLNTELISELIKIILGVASSFKRFFAPYITKLSKISMKLDSSCIKFPVLSKAFISLFKFYLDDVNFIDETFVHILMENVHLCEYHFFFIILLKKQAFVKVLNNYNLIELFFEMYDNGKTRILRVITNILELYKEQDPVYKKTNFDMKKIINDLTNREEYLLELYMRKQDISELNNVFNLICALLSIKTTHYFFVCAFCILMENGQILESKECNDVHSLYTVHILSIILPHDISQLFFQLDNKGIIYTLGEMFFKEENLFYLHQNIFRIFQYLLQLNPSKHYRLMNIVLSILESHLLKWGREFFARENDKEWNMTSLNAFSLELYKELMLSKGRLSKDYKAEGSDRCKEIMDRMDRFMRTDEYLFVKWYYERNIRSENLNLENEKDVETYYEDCISDTHVRYLYYMVMEHLPSSTLFDD